MNDLTKMALLRKVGAMAALSLLITLPARSQFIGGEGPSVLSRGGNAPGMRGSAPVSLTYYLGANGYYDDGVYTPEGQATPQVGQFGTGVSWGVYGGHNWGRSSLGLDYRGDYRYYTQNNSQNGSNNAIDVTFDHVFNRRWQMYLQETAGSTTQPFGASFTPSYLNTQYTSVPMTEIYNSRVYYSQTSAYAGYNWSSRTLFTFGGGGMLTHRTVSGLVNTNAGYAQASWQNRVSRNNALGVSYMFQRYTYPPAFGSSDINTVSGTFQRNLGKSSTFFASVGVSRVETLGTESYALSPEISAILGTTTGVRIFYSVVYIPAIQVSLTYRTRFWSYNVGASKGTTPGNGVYLTSDSTAASAGASYSPARRMSFGVNASYTILKSLWGPTNNFKYFQGGGGFSYNITRGLNFVTRADWRNMTAGTTVNNQGSVFATVGITYSSADRPLAIF